MAQSGEEFASDVQRVAAGRTRSRSLKPLRDLVAALVAAAQGEASFPGGLPEAERVGVGDRLGRDVVAAWRREAHGCSALSTLAPP